MKRLLLFALMFAPMLVKAQQFGGNPPSIKWQQVNTQQTRVIFSQGMDTVARRVAQTIAQMNAAIQPTIGYKMRRVNIVLQNQTTVSNAYVGLAPFRSEFYLTASQNSLDGGSLPWPEQLAIHEFRHVQQYNNFNVGLSRGLSFVFGEGGQALANALSVPDWFFEGDAVYNETLVSRQGRGRLPFFFNGFRALWAADKNYSWMKLRNGSYLDYTPNHYPLGYMMVAYGREKYGGDFWRAVTHDAAAFSTGFYPLQGAIKKHTGVGFSEFRAAALEHFKLAFNADTRGGVPQAANKHFIADNEYPVYINDSTLAYLKTSYTHPPQLVVSTGDTEKVIARQGITTDSYFSYNQGKIIYAGYRPDLRWGYRNYNELVLVDVNTGKEHRITRKTRYFSPAFSDDGSRIIAVDVATNGKSTLHVLNLEGKLLAAVPNPAALFYTYPKFVGDDKVVAAVRNFSGEMSLAVIEIATGSTSYLLPFSMQPVAFPQVIGGIVYFSKTSGKNDRLYAVNIVTRQVYSVNGLPAGLIGYYQPTLSSTKLAWTSFTAAGYKISEVARPDVKLVPAKATDFAALTDLNITILEQNKAANILATVRPDSLPVTGYNKLHGFFNFHSIFPSLNDPNYSLALVGNNVLNTFESQVTFDYNRDEGYKQIGFAAAYGALFPYIIAGADYAIDRRGFYKGNSIYYNETAIHGGLQVPLNLSAGGHNTSLTLSSSLYYSANAFQERYRTMFKDSRYTYVSSSISLSNQMQQARQNINPHFAQSLYINYKSSLSGGQAEQFLSTGSLYLPGLGVNHSLVISGAYQHKGENRGIGFSNDFPFSHGYTAESLSNMQKFAVSYHFPIAYPDAGFANLTYLLRLRGNFFYEHTHASATHIFADGSDLNGNFRSVGAAIFFDTRWFNQGAVSFGVRYSRLLDNDIFGGAGRNRIELVLPVAIF